MPNILLTLWSYICNSCVTEGLVHDKLCVIRVERDNVYRRNGKNESDKMFTNVDLNSFLRAVR